MGTNLACASTYSASAVSKAASVALSDFKNPYYNAKDAVVAAVPTAATGEAAIGAQGFVLVTGAASGKIVTIATCTEKGACTGTDAEVVTNTVEIE